MASAQSAPAIGSNNDQEPPATAKEFLSAVYKRELRLYLPNLNTPIDLTAIYSSRLDAPHPDEARSSQEPQPIRSRYVRVGDDVDGDGDGDGNDDDEVIRRRTFGHNLGFC